MNIGYLALGIKSNPTYGMLSDQGEVLFTEIKEYLRTQWSDTDPKENKRLKGISGCMDKLSAFLMQGQRMKKYHNELLDNAKMFNLVGSAKLPEPSIGFAKKGREECADFEASILQARAALDRLTWLISYVLNPPRTKKKKKSSFNNLEDILDKSQHPKAPQLLRIIKQCQHLKINLIYPGHPDPLRDFVAHKGAASEIMNSCFAIYYFGQSLVLVCDCELGDANVCTPVFRTSKNLCHDLPYVVLNTLATICDLATVGYEHFSPNWRLDSVVLSDFVGLGELQLNVIKRTIPSGFEHAVLLVDKSIMSNLVKVDPAPQSGIIKIGEPQ